MSSLGVNLRKLRDTGFPDHGSQPRVPGAISLVVGLQESTLRMRSEVSEIPTTTSRKEAIGSTWGGEWGGQGDCCGGSDGLGLVPRSVPSCVRFRSFFLISPPVSTSTTKWG